MSELKAISGHEIREDIDYNTRGIDPEDKEWHNYGKELCDTLFYRKFEADKVIAELEESHKKEVGQLLIEIVKLKKEKEYVVEQTAEVINGQERELQHYKYKRCLAMASLSLQKRESYKAAYTTGRVVQGTTRMGRCKMVRV